VKSCLRFEGQAFDRVDRREERAQSAKKDDDDFTLRSQYFSFLGDLGGQLS
jgi:hypothetical protein